MAASHERNRLMLLGSPPDMVHGVSSCGTRSSVCRIARSLTCVFTLALPPKKGSPGRFLFSILHLPEKLNLFFNFFCFSCTPIALRIRPPCLFLPETKGILPFLFLFVPFYPFLTPLFPTDPHRSFFLFSSGLSRLSSFKAIIPSHKNAYTFFLCFSIRIKKSLLFKKLRTFRRKNSLFSFPCRHFMLY